MAGQAPLLTGVLSDGCSVEEVVNAEPKSGMLTSHLEALLEKHHVKIITAVEDALSRHLEARKMYDVQHISSALSQRVCPRTAESLEEVDVESEEEEEPARFAFKTSQRSYSAGEVEKRATAKTATAEKLAAAIKSSKRYLSMTPETQSRLNRLTSSIKFEMASALLIICNAIFFGAEVQYLAASSTADHADIFKVGGIVFTMIFAVELGLRMAASRLADFLFSKQWMWNLLDMAIMFISILDVLLYWAGTDISSAAANLTFVRVVRLGRTVRIFRFVKHMKQLTSLRILVHSVLNTLKSLAWTVLLLVMILYVFGLIFTQASLGYLENPRSAEVAAELSYYFGSLVSSVYTLFKAISNGVSWEDVAISLGEVHPAWEALFVAYITFTYLAVLNVVTGVFCNSAIDSANQDRDAVVQAQFSMREVYTDQLKRLFKQIDNGRSGVLTLTVFEDGLKDPDVKAYFDGLDLTTDDAWNLFKLLDTDESNSIDMEEFVEGCLRLRGRARCIDIHMLLYESRWTMKRVADALRVLKVMSEPPTQYCNKKWSTSSPGVRSHGTDGFVGSMTGGMRKVPNQQQVPLPPPDEDTVEDRVLCSL